MKKRIGFLGAGAMGRSHVEYFHKTFGSRSEAVVVCARNEENIRKTREIAPGIRVESEEEAVISAADVDAIVVSTPNFTHVPLAKRILTAGKDLFLEKPCGISMEETQELETLARESDRILLIGHELRYSPYFHKIKSLIQEGAIGRPRMTWTQEFRGPFQPKSGEWIQDDRRSGGCLVDKNCHHFDLMNWWMDDRPARVAAFGGLAVNRVIEGPHQVHDHATVSFEYQQGARGTLQVCLFAQDFPREDLEMGVIGETGMIRTRISTLEILLNTRGQGQQQPEILKVDALAGQGWGGHLGFYEIHEAFLNSLESRQPPQTSVNACVDGTRLCIAAETAIREKRIVELE